MEKTLKYKIGSIFIKYRIRSGRGQVFTAEFEGLLSAIQKGGVIILLIKTYFGFLPPVWVLPIIWFGQRILEYILGLWDEKYLHWWMFENNYNSEHLNPWNKDLKDRIIDIQQRIK